MENPVKPERFIQILEIRMVDSSSLYEESNEGLFMFRLMSIIHTPAGDKRRKLWLNELEFEYQTTHKERLPLLIGFKKSMEAISKNEAMRSYAGNILSTFSMSYASG